MTRISRYGSMFIAAALSLAAVFVSLPVAADIHTETIQMRTTVAASSYPAQTSWLVNAPAFADSSVFRKTATALQVDTSQAIPISRFTRYWPQEYPSATVGDTLGVMWLTLTVAADDVSYSWAGTNAMDSVYVSAQVSIDGKTWTSVSGTPTREFFAAGVSPTTQVSLLGIEQAAGFNSASVICKCIPGVTSKATRLIINRNICTSPGYVRFIVSLGVGTGQFRLLATYQK